MHLALAVMHCFGNLAFSIIAHEPDFQRTRGTAHLICDQKTRIKFGVGSFLSISSEVQLHSIVFNYHINFYLSSKSHAS